jgi:predicted DsbA family dithiol-disulfide isomerase
MPALAIDLVSDVVCPWCFIGKRRLEQALSLTPEVHATVTFRPFQLDPSTPPEGTDLRETLRRKYGGEPDAMFARVEAVAREAGIPLDFQKIRRSCNTLRAHTLLRHALAKGTQTALADALFDGYFLRGLDIGQVAVLTELAVKHGFAADEAHALLTDQAELDTTRAEATALAGQGIRGVPFFILGGKLALSGAQPIEVFRGAIAQALA